MCMIRAAYLTHDSVNIKEMCYHIKLYFNTFTSTNKHFNTWKRNIVYPSGTENPNETSYQNNLSPSQNSRCRSSAIWPTLFTCHDWLFDNHEALLPAEPLLCQSYGWLREIVKRAQLKPPDAPSSIPLPTKHMTNMGERKEVSQNRASETDSLEQVRRINHRITISPK
jgi:hypothetical protein